MCALKGLDSLIRDLPWELFLVKVTDFCTDSDSVVVNIISYLGVRYSRPVPGSPVHL